MNVSKGEWSHPASYGEAKARLIGRVRYREARQQAAREREEVVFQLLVERGWDRWGIITAIAKELGVNKSIVCRDRQRILRSILGQAAAGGAEEGRLMWLLSDKRWTTIGRVATLISILGIITIILNTLKTYEFFTPLGPDLVGYCSYSEYILTPDINNMLSSTYNLRSENYTEGIQKALSIYNNEVEKIIEKDEKSKISELNKLILKHAIEELIRNIYNEILPASFRKLRNPYPGILDFHIINEGNHLAKDVAISVSFEGKAYLLSRSKDPRIIEVKRNIELGDIRQRDDVRVLFWSTEVPDLKHENFIRLIHSSGIGKIWFSISGYGFPLYTYRQV